MHARRVYARTGDRTYKVDIHPDGRTRVEPVAETPADAPSEAPPGERLDATAHYLGHGRVRLTSEGRRTLAWAVDAGESRWVFINGQVVEVEIDSRPTTRLRRARPQGPESLAAPMPATVVSVLVKAGEAVSRGAVLVLLEAMKMEMPLRAPHDAIVGAVLCAEGDLVQPGAILVELRES